MGLIKRVNFNNESLCVCDLKGKNDEFWIKRIIILMNILLSLRLLYIVCVNSYAHSNPTILIT